MSLLHVSFHSSTPSIKFCSHFYIPGIQSHTQAALVSSGINLLICEPESSCSALFTMNVVSLSREVSGHREVREAPWLMC